MDPSTASGFWIGSAASAGRTAPAIVVATTRTPIAQASQRQRRDGGRPSGNSSRMSAVRPSKGTNAKLLTKPIRRAHLSTSVPLVDT
jgi:hypothetical protein